MADLRQLGYEIRKARDRKGLTQLELGEYLGISRSSTAMLEAGQVKYPRLATLAAVARYLEIDPMPLYELAGLTLTAEQSSMAQLQWLSQQLDAEGNRVLIALGHALLQERLSMQGKAGQPSSPRSR